MLLFVHDSLAPSQKIGLSVQQTQHLKARRILIQDQQVVLCNGSVSAIGKIEILKKSICVHITHTEPLAPWTGPQLSLYISVIKPDRMGWLIEKATELGVYQIIPVQAERSQKIYCSEKNIEHYNQVVIAACTQSERKHLMKIPKTIDSLDIALSHAQQANLNVFSGLIAGSSQGATNKNMLPLILGNPQKMALFIGPEGGWSAREQALLEKSTQALSYPFGILRTETASLALTSWLMGLASHCRD